VSWPPRWSRSARSATSTVDVVVVVNAEDDVAVDAGGAEVVHPGRNLGIPAGRNLGFDRLRDRVDAVLFLDDDAVLAADDVLHRVVAALEADPSLAVVTMRLRDPDTGRTERRHVPRLVVGDPARSSWVTTFLGGACVIRADAYAAAGGLPEAFFYAHEETSLAWRLLDAGWRIRYRGDLEVLHPAAAPSRHADAHRLSARNRVLLAHLHLPFALAAVHVGAWTLISLVRTPGAWRAICRGLADGLRMRDLERQPIRWRTILRMTRLGRPPIL
jgi:GT2 family glycosyltransferase